ncbi:MAG: hypothetical protein KatS3mg131_3292 [Candidatus Tectimicrobiota bacterium]|nr:MAG: hypothetical protein KatS3mg131_3292 [Candidatus Tectomicrobia bacterium]
MTERLLAFIRLLRAHGLAVSVAESLDAMHAVARVGLEDREQLRLALRTTLVKAARDLPTFDALFAQFFSLPRPARRRRRRPEAGGAGGPSPKSHAPGQPAPSRLPPLAPTASLPARMPQGLRDGQPHLAPPGEALARLQEAWERRLDPRPAPFSGPPGGRSRGPPGHPARPPLPA